MSGRETGAALRRGWTTGACASGAARAAYEALLTGVFPDPVPVALPKGLRPSFALAIQELGDDFARAGVVKDAGDDPDVTHGALVVAKVRFDSKGAGVSFKAGEGVGTVTRPGLPLPPGEPAINPAPREMIRANLEEVAERLGVAADAVVEISVPGGEKIAERTANARLGILGGLSILGTTGVVVPYSCSAWIHSIMSGIDVARASGCAHIGAATGETSEAAIRARYGLPDHALIEMGDFAGGFLKHLRDHPVPRVTIAGGPAKLTKLAQGRLDLHSRRGAIDLAALAKGVAEAGGPPALAEAVAGANSALHAFELAASSDFDLPQLIAAGAWRTAAQALSGAPCELEVVVVGRDGLILATSGFRLV
ncbi:MAG: cobalt-precorrin-5B (C(1))-methyltransferase [Hyphomicrobiales bacterium]|nr:cobalt-precorrin-5B (C(1))-methyltransferase [Hyphomicrobiales bacterium]